VGLALQKKFFFIFLYVVFVFFGFMFICLLEGDVHPSRLRTANHRMIILPLLGGHDHHSAIAGDDVVLEKLLDLLGVVARHLLSLVGPDEDGQEEERERVEGDPGLRVLLHAVPHQLHLAAEGRPLVGEELVGGRVEERGGVLHHVGGHVVVVGVHLEVGAVHLSRLNVLSLSSGLTVQFFLMESSWKMWTPNRMSGKYVPPHLRGKKLVAVEVKPGVRFPSNATGEESANVRYKKAPTVFHEGEIPRSVKYAAMSRRLGTRKLRAKPVKSALKRGKTAKLQRHSAEAAASKKKKSGPRSAPK
jgi:hypothetical protein